MAGYIKLHRGWRNNEIFDGEYSRADAWVWLIENACWKPARVKIKGGYKTIERGGMTFSVRFMADKWGWSKSRVDRFIAELRSEGMIVTRSKIGTSAGHNAGQGQSILTICNYDKYQSNDNDERDNCVAEIGTSAGQARDKEEEGKEIKKRNIPNSVVSCPANVSPDVWADFLSLRRVKKAPVTATAIKAITVEAEKAGVSLERALTECVSRGWQGFKADWMPRASNMMTSDGWEIGM